MNDIDFERAALLMDIQSKVANVGVMNASIAGEAAEELKAINEACRQNAAERADKIRAEEQVAAQKALAAAEPVDDEEVVPVTPTPTTKRRV